MNGYGVVITSGYDSPTYEDCGWCGGSGMSEKDKIEIPCKDKEEAKRVFDSIQAMFPNAVRVKTRK